MKAGEFPDGARTLRARIDMASPNLWLRDPVLYRIRHAEHHHTGNAWCIYPMYEFAQLNLTHTVMSKRRLLRLVQEGFVRGWDDPRMPTLAAMRRRGFPAEA